ncbi:hypothetical protein VN97_g12488, partial [Penicillium thymicola]
SYKLGQKTIISEHYAQIVQAPIYIVHDMTKKPAEPQHRHRGIQVENPFTIRWSFGDR